MGDRGADDPDDIARRTLHLERVFDAPLARVYRAWTDPAILRQWWGPHGCTVYRCELDLREGGAWRIGLETAEGLRREVHGVFETIRPEAYLAFTWQWAFEGARGDRTRVEVAFAAVDARRTRLTLTQKRFETEGDRDGHRSGWSDCLDGLADYLRRTAGTSDTQR